MKTCSIAYRYAWLMLLMMFMQINFAWAESTSPSRNNEVFPVATFIQKNLIDHPDLIALKADLESSRASVRGSEQAVYNPELELDYEETDIKTKSIGITQTIDWSDQQGHRTSVASAEFDKARANYQVAFQSLIEQFLSRLADYQTSEDLTSLNEQSLNLMREFKQIAERRYQAGDLNQVEFNLAKLAHSQALMDQVNNLSQSVEARENLHALLGVQPDSLPVLPENLPKPILPDDLEAFLQQLPIVSQSLAEVKIAREKVNLRKSEQAWDPTIGLSVGKEGEESLAGITLSIPLNVRNNFNAEVEQAQHAFIAQEQRTHLAFRNTRAKLLMLHHRYLNLHNTWQNWNRQSQDTVKDQIQLIKKLWKEGDISASDYLLQLKQALEIQASYFELRNELWRAAFEWMSLTASIDKWLHIDTELPGKI